MTLQVQDACVGAEVAQRLEARTRALAARAISGEFGRGMAVATFGLDDAEVQDCSPEMHCAKAVMRIAEEAPLRVVAGERIVGAATLLEAAKHMVPLTPFQSTSHTTPGFEKLLRLGYAGIEREIEARLASGACDEKGRDLLEAMRLCLAAAARWQARNVEAAEVVAEACEDAAERAALLEAARVMRRVPERPAETFHEAVQALWSAFAFQRLCGNWPGIGRIDKMLGGYLRRDLQAGRITLEAARELLAQFWIKGCEWTGNACVWGSGDAQYYQNIVLAGVDEAGAEVLNEVTWLVLDVVEELHISDFPIAVRVNAQTPEKLLRRIAEVQRRGGGIVAIYNETLILKALDRFGYPAEVARDFANDGCWEIMIPGKTAFGYSPFDTLKILQEALGLQAGSEEQRTFEDFEAVYGAFRAGLRAHLQQFHEKTDGAWSGGRPAPLLSLLVDGCIEKGRGYHDRGAVYSVIASHAGGLPDTANSLHVIRKAVFEEQVVTWAELAAALRDGWEGHEALRRSLARYELYGNDNAEADAMMRRVYDDYVAAASEVNERAGVLRPAGISTFGREIEWRKHREATAYGRRRGDILATNLAPTPGTDLRGPTAVIRSFCSLDFEKLPNGVPLELKILPSCVRGEAGIRALVALMRSFVELGGVFLHIDVVDSELLKAAQREPEKYPNLAVRISGWSARFATLSHEWQDMIIQRTQQRV